MNSYPYRFSPPFLPPFQPGDSPAGPGYPGPGFPGQGGSGFFPGQGGQGFPGGPPPQGGQQGGSGGPPIGPPPATPPQLSAQVGTYAVDPGAISGCMYRYTYMRLNSGEQFWFYPTFLGRNSVAGYRWVFFRWIYFGIDTRRIASFQCV